MFSSLGLIKRFVPFLLTFAVGLLVASFFVPIVSPRYKSENRGWKHGKCKNKDAEIQRLRDQIADQELELQMWRDGDWNAPPPPMPPAVYMEEAPMPPPPPLAPMAPAKRVR